MAVATQRAVVGTGLSSRGKRSTNGSYDLTSWQGLTLVLQQARTSNLSDPDFARFRDLVLAYSQNGGDPKLKEEITEMLRRIDGNASLAVIDTADTSISDQKVVPVPAPVFESTQTEKQKPIAQRSRPKPRFVIPQSRNARIAVTADASARSSQPAVPVEEAAAPAPIAVEIPTPPAPNVLQSTVSEVVPPSVPVEVAPLAFKTLEEHKRRIAEIKHDVNLRVGNPLSLIDSQNQIGRQYMNALLASLRAAGGGGDIVSTMQTLEQLYSEIISMHTEKGSVSHDEVVPAVTEIAADIPEQIIQSLPIQPDDQSTPVPVPSDATVIPREIVTDVVQIPVTQISESRSTEPAPRHEPPVVSSVIPTDDVLQNPVPASQESEKEVLEGVVMVPKEDVDLSITPPIEQSAPSVDPEKIRLQQELEALRAQFATMQRDAAATAQKQKVEKKVHQKKTVPAAKKTTPTPEPKDHRDDELRVLRERLATLSASTIPTSAAVQLTREVSTSERRGMPDSTGGTKQDAVVRTTVPPERTEREQHDAASVMNTVVAQQENLDGAEITEALRELLLEWSLFEKSGFFGVGPGGMEHPLFEQLRILPMSSVMAGRFENASPDILQSLKDYVVAWQHEQGVTYLQSETFEHYLRRVVTRILKRRGE